MKNIIKETFYLFGAIVLATAITTFAFGHSEIYDLYFYLVAFSISLAFAGLPVLIKQSRKFFTRE